MEGRLLAPFATAQVVWRGDVVESADLGPGNAYSFRLWPGRYMLRAPAELPVGEDEFLQSSDLDSAELRPECEPLLPARGVADGEGAETSA